MLPETEARLAANASVVYRAAAAALRPDPRERISDWAERHRIVPDGASAKPGPWRNEVAPELVEPMDCMSPEHPCEHVLIGKPGQSGGSATAENFIGFIMHRAPGPAMYVGPTVKAAKDWKIEKLDPMIQATAVLSPMKRGVVAPQRSRSGEGSTSDRIVFKGGYLLLAGANSAATLRQHTIRYMVRDDRAGWTDNAEGEGDPVKLSEQRLKTYRVFGLSKLLDISTFLDKGDSFDRDFSAGDLRRYYMACLGCGAVTDWDWEDVEKNPDPPFRARLRCPACGHAHGDADKPQMKAPANGACWIPTAPDADGVVPPKTIPAAEIQSWRDRDTGRTRRSYWMTGVINTFDRLDLIAQKEADAGDDPDLRKPFENLDLGRPYEAKGDGPAWEVLSARREAEWHRGMAPAGVLYSTLSVDVQGDGLYWERVGWGPGKESWAIDHGYLAGETDAPLEGAWPKLDLIVDRGYVLGGARLADDMIGVDSGYNADAVYSWVRRRHNALALKGVDGWSKLPIFRGEAAEIKKTGLSAGKARRFGLMVWLVGTYGLKGALMVYLGRDLKEGVSGAPTGYCHFPADAEEDYFRHLVSEYVKDELTKKGERTRIWEKRGPNHWLDCRVYNMALTHYVGLWAWDEARWARRAAELAETIGSAALDLFEPAVTAVPAARPIAEEDGPAADAPAARPIGRANPALESLIRLTK